MSAVARIISGETCNLSHYAPVNKIYRYLCNLELGTCDSEAQTVRGFGYKSARVQTFPKIPVLPWERGDIVFRAQHVSTTADKLAFHERFCRLPLNTSCGATPCAVLSMFSEFPPPTPAAPVHCPSVLLQCARDFPRKRPSQVVPQGAAGSDVGSRNTAQATGFQAPV